MSFRNSRRTRQRSRARGSTVNSPQFDRKLQQVCRQVARALAYVVPGDLSDPLLQDLSVVAVRPGPDASRLAVWFRTPRQTSDAADVLEHLERVRGRLRAEVAAAITRKRAPELSFHLLFGEEVDHAE